jgi:hypothetical protein
MPFQSDTNRDRHWAWEKLHSQRCGSSHTHRLFVAILPANNIPCFAACFSHRKPIICVFYKGRVYVHFDDDVTLQVVFGDRLRELVIDGQITESIYLAALESPAVAHGIIMGYLDSCWQLTA